MSYMYKNALQTAERFVEMLKPYCDRIHIAGSIRRALPVVKDIEIVCQPKKELKNDLSSLFQDEGSLQTSGDFIHALAKITSVVIKGNPNGRYMQIRTTSRVCPDICLDLFMPDPDDYFRQLVIRTGSAEWVQAIIAVAWKRKGWCGTGETGLRLQSDCEQIQNGDVGKKWRLINRAGEKPPAWQSEQEFFAWLGLPYTDPVLRDLKRSVNQSA